MSTGFCTFYIVRHGQAELNRDNIVMGQIDSPLTETGKEQARALHEAFSEVQFDAVLISDLSRAVETARLITGTDGFSFHIDTNLRERNFGSLEGESQTKLKTMREGLELLSTEEQWNKKLVGGMESDKELFTRVEKSLRTFAQKYLGSKVLVVTHSGPIRTLLMGLGFYNLNELGPGFVGNGEYAVINMNENDASLIVKLPFLATLVLNF
jgi:broad specificity phosphatase PhoE